jgi:hypothetical protein
LKPEEERRQSGGRGVGGERLNFKGAQTNFLIWKVPRQCLPVLLVELRFRVGKVWESRILLLAEEKGGQGLYCGTHGIFVLKLQGKYFDMALRGLHYGKHFNVNISYM